MFRRSELRGLSKLVPKRGTDPYTDAELAQLWAALRKDKGKGSDPVCRTAVATGARVDLANATLTIRYTYDGTAGALTAPRTRSRARSRSPPPL